MRPRQWKADLIGLVLKQSKTPTTVSSQKNVKLNNTPLMMTKYSNVCMVTQSPGHHSHQCQTEQEQLCNTLVSSPHSWVLLFWQLGLWSAVTNRQNIQIYFLANLSWVAGTGKARRFVQSGYPFHSCKESFQKNPTMRSITRLQLSVIIECFLTSKFCKGFLTLQVQQSSLGLETTVFNYFPSRQFLCPSKLRYQGKILVKCVQKGILFWKPLTYPMHIRGGERSFPFWIGNFLAWLQAIFWKIASLAHKLKAAFTSAKG